MILSGRLPRSRRLLHILVPSRKGLSPCPNRERKKLQKNCSTSRGSCTRHHQEKRKAVSGLPRTSDLQALPVTRGAYNVPNRACGGGTKHMAKTEHLVFNLKARNTALIYYLRHKTVRFTTKRSVFFTQLAKRKSITQTKPNHP